MCNYSRAKKLANLKKKNVKRHSKQNNLHSSPSL